MSTVTRMRGVHSRLERAERDRSGETKDAIESVPAASYTTLAPRTILTVPGGHSSRSVMSSPASTKTTPAARERY